MNETDFTAAIFEGKCPRCGRGALFDGWITLHETCDACGARFERWAGSWTGATVMGYVFGCVVATILILVLWARGGLGSPWSSAFVAVASMATTALCYRFIKAWWIGMLHSMGYIFPDSHKPPAE